MKRGFIGVPLMLAMLCALVPARAAAAETDIKLGDYVRMGEYYGDSIAWRCVSFEKIKGYDENGCPIIDSTDTVTEYEEGYLPLMLSDKIICIKTFDGFGTNTSGSHGRKENRQSHGSNYWGDSNMRSWLNSSAAAGNVTWLCGNPPDKDHVNYHAYDQEAGFLTNFSQPELDAIEETTQKSLLSYVDEELDTTGADTYHKMPSYSIADTVQNYDSCYAENITDKMFLLDVQQVNTVYNNGYILGEKYYIGEPTAQCAANAEYNVGGPAVGKKYSYWLRSPYGGIDHLPHVRYIDKVGVARYTAAKSDYVGVRPAFFLDPETEFSSGTGTADSPYAIGEAGTGLSIAVSSSGGAITVTVGGSAVDFPDAQPFIDDNGRTQMPIRAVAEALGAAVTWDDATKTAAIERNGTTVYISVGKTDITAGGKTITMDTAAQIIDDRTYIPIRFVGEALGAEVNWIE